LPAIAPDSKALPFGDHEDLPDDEAQALRQTARDAIRSELGVAYVDELADLIHRRAMLILSWKEALDKQGLALDIPITMALAWDPTEQLGAAISEQELGQLIEIQEGLAVKAMPMALADLQELMIGSVEQHELQHRIDFAKKDQLPFPAALESYVGPLTTAKGEERPLAFHARAELSAYLAEIGRGPTPKIVLTQLVNFLLDQSHWGSAETYASLVALEYLAGALDIPLEAPLIQGRSIKGTVASALYRSIAAASSARLRAAATDSWSRLFKGDLASPRLAD
jgi:hypothetical protein